MANVRDHVVPVPEELPEPARSYFRPILGLRAHEEVVDQITYAIRAGICEAGTRLPSIEELAQLMNVSKPTVGEAVKVLQQKGVVVAQRGSSGGVTVVSSNVPAGTLSRLLWDREAASLAELAEARRPIEMELAMLAGERATAHDFEAMRETIRVLEQHRHDRKRTLAIHYDSLFHYRMGRAARSRLLAFHQHQILQQIWDILRSYYEHEEDPEIPIRTHRATLIALESRDRKKIERAMNDHLAPLEALVAERSKSTGRRRDNR
jgi:GntR family transcriptional repressor for pyruvate dehydrogenase complex